MKLMYFIQVLLKFNLKVILWHNDIYAKKYALSKLILIFRETHGIIYILYNNINKISILNMIPLICIPRLRLNLKVRAIMNLS